MGAIIVFSTSEAFFRHLTDQSFVPLERETNGRLYLSLVEEMLFTQPMLDKGQLQGFQAAAQFLEKLDKQGQKPPSAFADEGTSELNREESDGRKTCAAASSHNSITVGTDICQHTRQVPTGHLQTGITLPTTPTRQLLGSMQHYTTDFVLLPVRRNEHDPNVTVGSRRPQEGRMPSTDGTAGRGATTPWCTGLKAMIKDLLFSNEGVREKPLLGLAKMNRSQLADKARQLHVAVSENHTRGILLDQDLK